MLSRAVTVLARATLPVAVVMGGCLAQAQMGGAGQGPARMPGSVTNTGFAGALAGTVQGTYPGGAGRSPQGLYLGGLFPAAAPYPNWAPAPPAIFNVSYEAPAPAPAADGPPPPPFVFAPPPERPTVSVFVASTETAEAPPATVSPELRRRNSQNLEALAAVLHFPGPGEPAAAASYSAMPAAGVSYSAMPPAASSSETEPLLLIAFKDRNVVTAIAYWTDGGTLHFVTPAREQKLAPLGDVDWERSRTLNNERGMPFSVMP